VRRHYEDSSWATSRDADGNVVVRTWCDEWVTRDRATTIRHAVRCEKCRENAKID
jgi:hypothetical protein